MRRRPKTSAWRDVSRIPGWSSLRLGHGPAERLAALEEQRDLLAQRNRLAQELHDSIGHTLTASTIQAAVAAELMGTGRPGS